jgi:phosphoribosyl-ATP pyrophosphohydrolase
MQPMRATLQTLEQTIAERRKADPSASYVAKLTARGRGKIAQKVGEEAVEVVIEAVRDNRKRLIEESADLMYHLLVLWADMKVVPGEVWTELARREGMSGLEEKAARDPAKSAS